MKKLCLKYGIVVCPKSEPTKQMVLGTDNQAKEAPMKAPELTGALSLYPSMSPYMKAPLPQKPTQVCPLVETEWRFERTWVHKPSSLLERRQIKQDLESYTDEPATI